MDFMGCQQSSSSSLASMAFSTLGETAAQPILGSQDVAALSSGALHEFPLEADDPVNTDDTVHPSPEATFHEHCTNVLQL